MLTFAYNSCTDIVCLASSSHIYIDFIDATCPPCQKKIVCHDTSVCTYIAIMIDASMDITIDHVGPHAASTVQCLYIGSNTSHIVSRLSSDHTQTDVSMTALLTDDTTNTITGKVDIVSGVRQVSGYLHEENIILGKHISIKTLPMLDVHSNDVSASHGCKIERLDDKKLFYAMSRGLTREQSISLFVDAYIGRLFGETDVTQYDRYEMLIGHIYTRLGR
jgi:Fe-S cluster assembly scaffold protein SufB